MALSPPESRASIPNPREHPGRWLALLLVVATLGAGPSLHADPAPPAPTAAPQPPAIAERIPAPGSSVPAINAVEVVFNQPVQGVDAADLLANGLPASSLAESAPGQFTFGFPGLPDGTVELQWAPGHGIAAADDPGSAFAGGAWTLTVDARLARRQVMISEFMADADVLLYDDDCDRSDWIEIHNAGTTAVDLAGWALTDDPAAPAQWRFPAHLLEPGAYLIVFASQKNKTNLPPRACRTRTNSMAGYHTNFRLDPDGEYLALVAPDGEVISAFSPVYPPQRRDISYGRVPGSPALSGYFVRPTPRAANSATGNGFAPEVRFSRDTAPFLDPFLLTLSSPAADAVIGYTLDGSFPADTNRNLLTYTGPLAITNTVQVRARAFMPGLLPGAPASETYVRLTNDPGHLLSFTSALPVIVLTTLRTATIGASGNTPVHLSLFEPREGRTTLLGQPTLATRAGIKTRGSSTGGQPQSNFAIEWWDEFNQDRDLPILGMPGDSEWVLYAPNEFDAALIHNPFTMEISRQMDFAAPRTRFVEVYLNKGGPLRSNEWFGLYVLMEKPGLSKGRINAPKAAPEDVQDPEVTGSYLFKTDRLDPGDAGFNAGGAGNAYVEPKEREMRSPQRAPQLAYLQKYFRDLDNAFRATNPDFRHPTRGYRGYIEITNWIDFHVLETLSGQVDAIRLSTYFYKRREGKLEYGPRWDYDRAWESKGDGRDDNPRVWDTGGGLFGTPWWRFLYADRDAWQLWIDRWQAHRTGPFARTNLFRIIDSLTNEIRSVQVRENRRWTATAPRVSYPNEIRIMKTWISNRLDWIDSQFAPAPILSSPGATVAPGFEVTLAIPAGISNPTNVAIFYSLDGSDPRPSAGTNTPTALRYSGPIRITTNTHLVARLRDLGKSQRSGPPTSSTWSGPASATFVVHTPALAVTELMYHPAPPPDGSPFSEDDYEFLELRNLGSSPVDLAGCQFTAGIDFTFPTSNPLSRLGPGDRLILVRNLDAFRSRNPTAEPVAGVFAGSLSDAGERIAFAGPVGEPIFELAYSDNPFPLTDGPGFALVNPDADAAPPSDAPVPPSDASRWRPGAQTGGSPGLPDADPDPTPPPVVIHEILAAPAAGDADWIELHHPGPGTADVSGWWLTDDLDTPRKVRLPQGTRIAAGGYRVIPASTFSASVPGGFGLSSAGDAIWLLSADFNGNLTGWLHGFRFGPSATGRTWGRHLLSTGTETFVPDLQPTPGTGPATPLVGPVVVRAVMTRTSPLGNALGVRDGFVDLHNISPRPVPLAGPAGSTLPWRLRGDLEFDFNSHGSPVLPPDGRLIVVGFDPSLDRFELAGFRARHHLDATIPIVGPWRGNFTPAHPSLRLLPPTPADGSPASDTLPAGDEQFDATPAPPWPASAFIPGTAMVRRLPAGLAADGSQWTAALPMPGQPDADLDTLPDAWELAYGFNPASDMGPDGADGDPDADGFPNRIEHRNGTDPRTADEGLPLHVYASGPRRVTGYFHVPPGDAYLLETTTDPGLQAWEPAESITAPVESAVVIHFETRPGTVRLYRLRRP